MTIEQAVATILVALIVNLPSYFLSREPIVTGKQIGRAHV